MIATLKVIAYGRKSNPDEAARGTETSVKRQLEDARRFIARHADWRLTGEFSDEAKSGVLGEDRRPGLKSVMDRVRAKAVDVVVMAANDRLARNQFEAMSLLYEFHKAGVRLVYHNDGREVDLKTEAGIFTEAAHNFGGAFKRVSDSSHMVASLMQKARNGFVSGGAVFGYVNARVDGHVERRIDPPTAKIVKRIFAEFVAGRTVGQIVKGLNRDKAPTPAHAGGWKAPKRQLLTPTRGLVWMKPTIRGVLRRPIYKGLVISRWRKFSETFEHMKPDLRIVDDRVWAEAQRMLAKNTRAYLRHTNGKLWGKPPANVESPYVLTGMLACGICGSVMSAESRPSGDSGRRIRVYWCRGNKRGARRSNGEVCGNNIVVPMTLLDASVLRCIEPYLSADVIADAVKAAVARAGSRSSVAAERERIGRELKAVDQELGNILTLVKRGIVSETVQDELAATEGRRRDLRTALARLDQADAFRASAADLEATLTGILRDWVNIATKPTVQQRQLLRKLLPARITVMPYVKGSRRWVDFHGDLALAPIISGIAPAVGDDRPDDRGHRWWPQRDSNPCFSLERAVS
jgi:site-specific DNA recombinase